MVDSLGSLPVRLYRRRVDHWFVMSASFCRQGK
jgi:hypothetical protein